MEDTNSAPKIVIVEDDASLAEIYNIRMQAMGYHCVTAYDGAQALTIIERERPNLVLLDLMLPNIPGDQVLRTMRQMEWGKNIKVYIISNLNESDAPASLREHGIEGYSVKANMMNDDLDNIVEKILTASAEQ